MADDDSNSDPGPPRGALVVLVLMVVLVVVTLFVMHRINQASTMQDCIQSGRTNCAPVASPAR